MLETAYILSLGEGFASLKDDEKDKFEISWMLAEYSTMPSAFVSDQVVIQNKKSWAWLPNLFYYKRVIASDAIVAGIQYLPIND